MQAALTENPQKVARQTRASPAEGALSQAAAEGEGGGVSPPPGADLAIEVGDVPLNSVGAQPEAPGDLCVGFARGHQPQYLQFPAAQSI